MDGTKSEGIGTEYVPVPNSPLPPGNTALVERVLLRLLVVSLSACALIHLALRLTPLSALAEALTSFSACGRSPECMASLRQVLREPQGGPRTSVYLFFTVVAPLVPLALLFSFGPRASDAVGRVAHDARGYAMIAGALGLALYWINTSAVRACSTGALLTPDLWSFSYASAATRALPLELYFIPLMSFAMGVLLTVAARLWQSPRR